MAEWQPSKGEKALFRLMQKVAILLSDLEDRQEQHNYEQKVFWERVDKKQQAEIEQLQVQLKATEARESKLIDRATELKEQNLQLTQQVTAQQKKIIELETIIQVKGGRK